MGELLCCWCVEIDDVVLRGGVRRIISRYIGNDVARTRAAIWENPPDGSSVSLRMICLELVERQCESL